MNDMIPHKFYVIEIVPKKYKMRDYNDVLVKFGITKNMNVLERFNPYYDERYKDFHHKVKCFFYTAKLSPQPQLAVAFGLIIFK